MATFFFTVAALVVIRFALGGAFALFTSKPMMKPGYYRVLAVIGVFAVGLGLVFALVT